MNFLRNILIVGVVSLMTLSLASCGSSRNVVANSGSPTATGKSGSSSKKGGSSAGKPSSRPAETPLARIDFAAIPSLTPTLERVLREADSWIGTPYRYGGNDRDGVDCSGFVLQVYLKATEIALPRTSRQQQEYCRDLDRVQLEPGDLVFFTSRGSNVVGHVGIYIGNNQMIHASSSQGVVISSLQSNYYVQNYYGGGRIDRFYTMLTSERNGPEKKKSAPEKKKPESEKKKSTPVVKPTESPRPTVFEAPATEIAETPVEDSEARKEISSTIAARVSRIGNFTGSNRATKSTKIIVADEDEEELTDLFD